jgi:hypothetical protein
MRVESKEVATWEPKMTKNPQIPPQPNDIDKNYQSRTNSQAAAMRNEPKIVPALSAHTAWNALLGVEPLSICVQG